LTHTLIQGQQQLDSGDRLPTSIATPTLPHVTGHRQGRHQQYMPTIHPILTATVTLTDTNITPTSPARPAGPARQVADDSSPAKSAGLRAILCRICSVRGGRSGG
jgi:hypothetical protein